MLDLSFSDPSLERGSGWSCVLLQFGEEPRYCHTCQAVSICTIADADSRTYDVTGMSPQSRTVAQLLNGFVSNGTLYPPLKPTLREPVFTNRISAYMLVGETD